MRLNKSWIATGLTLLLASNPIQAGTQICHIANAGFFIESSGTGVLIDAVMKRDDYEQTFALPSEEVLTNMTFGQGAFESVKLALVTHKHGDHFDAEASLQHLRSSEVRYIMPPEAYELMKSAGMTELESARVQALLPNWDDGPLRVSGDGYEVDVYRIDHGPNMPQNLGYRIHINGKTFFHTGDINATPERLKAAGLQKTPVDYMMMPFWYALQQKDAIDTAWQLGTMIATHYHAKEQAWMADAGGPEGLRRAAASVWPNSLRIDREMQCEEIDEFTTH